MRKRFEPFCKAIVLTLMLFAGTTLTPGIAYATTYLYVSMAP